MWKEHLNLNSCKNKTHLKRFFEAIFEVNEVTSEFEKLIYSSIFTNKVNIQDLDRDFSIGISNGFSAEEQLKLMIAMMKLQKQEDEAEKRALQAIEAARQNSFGG